MGTLLQSVQTINQNQETLNDNQIKYLEELSILSDLTVPALRNIENIIMNIQTQQKDLSNNVHEIQEWLKLQLLSLMGAVKEVKSESTLIFIQEQVLSDSKCVVHFILSTLPIQHH